MSQLAFGSAVGASTPPRKKRARGVWLRIHLYLGLGGGALIALVGLTGSMIVFFWELDELLNPCLVIESPGDRWLPFDEIVAKVRTANPERPAGWTLSLPRDRHGAMQLTYAKPAEKAGAYYAPLMVSVDPFTGRILASRFWGDTVATWLYDLHFTLTFGAVGRKVVGFIGIGLLISIISGMALWWPPPEKWRQAFVIKRNAAAQRRVFDLHRVTGIYAVIVLFVLSLTGIYLVFPNTVIAGLKLFAPDTFNPYRTPTARPVSMAGGRTALKIPEILSISERELPGTELTKIFVPGRSDEPYRVIRRYPDEGNLYFPMNIVVVDPWSGDVLGKQDVGRFGPLETILDLQFPLHSGEALGLGGRLTVLLSGLAPTFLLVTGFLRWRHKRRAAQLNQQRRRRALPGVSPSSSIAYQGEKP
ncbi:MAG TPA: PepSY domain-containing protein [Rhodospirillaceae bacterium]|nr:PepSY domain-containing protein [Rhodospirillaceae bacterium]